MEAALGAKGFGQREFCRLVGASSGLVADVLRGRRRPPPEVLDEWAAALGLEGDEADHFIEEGLLCRASERLRDHVAVLRRRMEAAEAEVMALRKRKKASSPNLKPHGLAN